MATKAVPYWIRVRGGLGPAAREAFDGLSIEAVNGTTLVSGELDQAALRGVLDRLSSLGLELLEVTQTDPATRPPTAGAGSR